jgi:hypothetical protein
MYAFQIIPTRRLPRCFIFIFLSVAFACLVLVGIFNYYVDPYRLFTPDPIASMNQLKARPNQFQQEIRSLIGERVRPELLLIGNSTFEIGIDPALLLESGVPGPIYNQAIGGFTLEDSTVGLQRIFKDHSPRFAIVGVSFTDYLTQGSISGSSKVASETSWMFSDFHVKFMSLMGAEATFDSFRTLLIPYRAYPQSLTALGFNPMLEYLGHARTSGYKVLFDTTNKKIHSIFLSASAKVPPNIKTSRSLRELLDLIIFLTNEGVNVVIVIPPFHENFFSGVVRYGLMEVYQSWISGVLDLSRQDAIRTSVKVVDFGCGGSALHEKIPDLGDKVNAMNYYWDSVHFKSIIGTRMISLLFDNDVFSLAVPRVELFDDGVIVGRVLSSDNIQKHQSFCRDLIGSN